MNEISLKSTITALNKENTRLREELERDRLILKGAIEAGGKLRKLNGELLKGLENIVEDAAYHYENNWISNENVFEDAKKLINRARGEK